MPRSDTDTDLSQSLRRVLRTTRGPCKRYHRLAKLQTCCARASAEERGHLRDTVVRILERHHLPAILLELRMRLVEQLEDCRGDMAPLLRDSVQLLGLWMNATGNEPDLSLYEQEVDREDDPAVDERHPLFDRDACPEQPPTATEDGPGAPEGDLA